MCTYCTFTCFLCNMRAPAVAVLGSLQSVSQPLLDSAPAAKSLLTCLLKMDPAYRMSASQILETPWITVRQPTYSLLAACAPTRAALNGAGRSLSNRATPTCLCPATCWR